MFSLIKYIFHNGYNNRYGGYNSRYIAMIAFMKTPNRPLHEQVREYLREQYEGERDAVSLPSLRQLSDTLGVNHLTISRALRDLEADGLLKIVPGKGTFVVATPGKTIELLSLHNDRQSIADTSIRTLRGMIEGASGPFQVHGSTLAMPPFPNAAKFAQDLAARGVAAMGVFGFGYLEFPDDFYETQFLFELSQQMPLVLVNKAHPLLKLPCIYCDPRPQLREYLTECYEKGARRFGYIGNDRGLLHLRARFEAFQEFLLDHGLQRNVEHMPHPDRDNATQCAAVLQNPPLPDVIIASGFSIANFLIIQAQQQGLLPGRDFKLLCFASSPEEVQSIAGFIDYIAIAHELVGRNVVAYLQKRLSGAADESPVTMTVPGRLVKRLSV